MDQAHAPVCVLQHTPWHGPGYFREVLERQGVPFVLHRVTAVTPVPEAGEPFAALAIFGGPLDVHDAAQETWMRQELALIQRAIEAGIPVLGHSFGAELIAAALDCQVMRNTVRQIGWFDIQPLREDATAQRWLEGIPDWLEIFKWHVQSFDIPPGATHLFRSEWDASEAFLLDNVLAFQGHLEATPALIDRWMREYAPQLSQPREDPRVHTNLEINWEEIVQGPEAICSDLDNRIARLHRAADLIYGRWLKLLDPDRTLRC